MLRAIFAALAFFGLCSCVAAELALLPLAPAMSAIGQSKIVQPINVVNASGHLLASPNDPSSEIVATFRVERSTVRCTAKHTKLERLPTFPIKCDDGQQGYVKLQAGDYVNAAALILEVGQISREEASANSLDRPLYTLCSGNLNFQESSAEPFQISCTDKRHIRPKANYSTYEDRHCSGEKTIPGTKRVAAAEVVRVSRELYRTTVWFNPLPKMEFTCEAPTFW